MSAWVVDTNVAVIANGGHTGASLDCVAACAEALQEVMAEGVLLIDDGGGVSEILEEYRRYLDGSGQPGPGDAFMRWVLLHEWGEALIGRMAITKNGDGYDEVPDEVGRAIDPSDRKFVAVAIAGGAHHPRVIEGLDSKWVGWVGVLASLGVHVDFPCDDEIREIYARKFPEERR